MGEMGVLCTAGGGATQLDDPACCAHPSLTPKLKVLSTLPRVTPLDSLSSHFSCCVSCKPVYPSLCGSCRVMSFNTKPSLLFSLSETSCRGAWSCMMFPHSDSYRDLFTYRNSSTLNGSTNMTAKDCMRCDSFCGPHSYLERLVYLYHYTRHSYGLGGILLMGGRRCATFSSVARGIV